MWRFKSKERKLLERFILSGFLSHPVRYALPSIFEAFTHLFKKLNSAELPAISVNKIESGNCSSRAQTNLDVTPEQDKSLVLVVEDNIEMNRYICQILAKEFRVIPAYNGKEGLALTRKFNPNLIITDFMMPEVNGQQMISEIRAQPEFANTPIIVLSAKADEEFRIKMLNEGSDDYLIKPFSAKELIARSRNLIKINERQSWLQSIIDQMPEGVIVFDQQGKIVHLNNVAKSLARDTGRMSAFGVPLVLDIRDSSGKILPPEQLPVFQAFTSGKAISGAEFSILSPNDELIPVLVNAAPVKTISGKNGAIGVFQNISLFKELETLRKEWASMIAHELRQPVASINLRANLLKELSTNEIPDQNYKNLDAIIEDSRVLDRLINDLLDFSRLEANRMDLKPKIINLSEKLTEITERFKQLSVGHSILFFKPSSQILVQVDPDRFQQIVANLLSNAVKYSKANSEIRVVVRENDNVIEIIVSNIGPGISQDQLPLLFNRFTRTKEAQSGNICGIGLGLFIVKGLVEAHGGKIWAESYPGETTSFHFTIPRWQEQISNKGLGNNAVCSSEKVEFKILILDDSFEMRLLFRMQLEKAGAIVKEASSVGDAMLILTQNPPDIIISDIEMPEVNGFDFIKQLQIWCKQNKIYIPIIALTGHSDDLQLRKITSAGFDAIVSKTNYRADLFNIINNLVTNNRKLADSLVVNAAPQEVK